MPVCNLTDANLQVISTIISHTHTHTHTPMCPPMHVQVRVPTHILQLENLLPHIYLHLSSHQLPVLFVRFGVLTMMNTNLLGCDAL